MDLVEILGREDVAERLAMTASAKQVAYKGRSTSKEYAGLKVLDDKKFRGPTSVMYWM